ncbi:MAG: nucleotide exchange factor GrpE [Patescibacteria group bacterium]|jgi:molecular chaperone GrpE
MKIKKKTDPKLKTPENKIKELETKMVALEKGWQRTQADFENYQKRSEEQSGLNLNLMKADFLTKITPVLDNFRRAFTHAPDDNFATGIKHIEKQLEDILVSEGLKKISANPGEKFDCNLHEAISCEENKKVAADHIIAETESGWMFGDRVIKPTKVRVSKGK